MSEHPTTNQRPATPEVVDLTNDGGSAVPTSTSTRTTTASRRKPLHRSNELRGGTYIDLTAVTITSPPQPHMESVASTSSSSASNGIAAGSDVEVLYECRRTTPQPPTRMGRQQHVMRFSVDLAKHAQSREVEVVTDDDDLANVQIPSKKQKSSQSKEDETASLFCPICLETYAKLQTQNVSAVVISACSHVFCRKCIEETLKTAKSCPKCRRALRGKTPFKALFF
ncbi:E3 ubiquitin-protein ligase RNF4-like isoform X2 [Varroa destructor]|uniref:RING-type domain-containing protein n=1 Tax=Varroa destructor TaxID=109461 RepID=A0A7M7J8A7_VARDE|nr:E3 ubiquitin-protein ligase RNF4-like isoform X2 [Varroa destructor]